MAKLSNWFLFLETESHNLAQAGLELVVILLSHARIIVCTTVPGARPRFPHTYVRAARVATYPGAERIK